MESTARSSTEKVLTMYDLVKEESTSDTQNVLRFCSEPTPRRRIVDGLLQRLRKKANPNHTGSQQSSTPRARSATISDSHSTGTIKSDVSPEQNNTAPATPLRASSESYTSARSNSSWGSLHRITARVRAQVQTIFSSDATIKKEDPIKELATALMEQSTIFAETTLEVHPKIAEKIQQLHGNKDLRSWFQAFVSSPPVDFAIGLAALSNKRTGKLFNVLCDKLENFFSSNPNDVRFLIREIRKDLIANKCAENQADVKILVFLFSGFIIPACKEKLEKEFLLLLAEHAEQRRALIQELEKLLPTITTPPISFSRL